MPVTVVQRYRDDREKLHDSAESAEAANERYDVEKILEGCSLAFEGRVKLVDLVDWLSHVNEETLDPLIRFLVKRRAESHERRLKFG